MNFCRLTRCHLKVRERPFAYRYVTSLFPYPLQKSIIMKKFVEIKSILLAMLNGLRLSLYSRISYLALKIFKIHQNVLLFLSFFFKYISNSREPCGENSTYILSTPFILKTIQTDIIK